MLLLFRVQDMCAWGVFKPSTNGFTSVGLENVAEGSSSYNCSWKVCVFLTTGQRQSSCHDDKHTISFLLAYVHSCYKTYTLNTLCLTLVKSICQMCLCSSWISTFEHFSFLWLKSLCENTSFHRSIYMALHKHYKKTIWHSLITFVLLGPCLQYFSQKDGLLTPCPSTHPLSNVCIP